MPVERARIDPEHGPLIRVLMQPHASRPDAQPYEGFALIDTGAKHSGVHAPIAGRRLGWQVKGAVELFTPGTTSDAMPVYGGHLIIKRDGTPVKMDFVGLVLGYYARDLEVVALLGRDFLENKVLAYDGRKGEWTLHW